MLRGDCNICINGKMPSYSATCVECGLSRKNYKPQTKVDRIRAMTDEELAKILYEVWFSCGRFMGDRECKGDCEKCWLEWLKEEECECCFKRVLDRMNQEEE